MIQLNELLLAELKKESANTRKILQAVPDEHLGWKPHEKSFTLSRMASHVAEMPRWFNWILDSNELDMAATPLERFNCTSTSELLAFFDEKLSEAEAAISNATNEQLEQNWTFRRGEHIIVSSSRYDAVRSWMMNHQIHHRGQLSVYLRLLDVHVPGMYGPSADDVIARQKAEEAAK